MPYDSTIVSIEKSQAAIKKLLAKLNVQATRFTNVGSVATLEFVRKSDTGQLIPYKIKIEPRFKRTPIATATRELDRAQRQVWRVCYWWLKAKVEAIEFGLVEFETEWLPFMLLDNGRGQSNTVAQVFSASMAGKLTSGNDPFTGLKPAEDMPVLEAESKEVSQ